MGTVVTENNQIDDQDNFFDLLSRFQSKRMDDQRCSLIMKDSLKVKKEENVSVEDSNASVANGDAQEDLLDMIMSIQSKRMDEQRVELPNLPGLCRLSLNSDTGLPKNDRQNSTRTRCLDDKQEMFTTDIEDKERVVIDSLSSNTKLTMPDEDFFSLISRLQSGRMDDQRAKLKK